MKICSLIIFANNHITYITDTTVLIHFIPRHVKFYEKNPMNYDSYSILRLRKWNENNVVGNKAGNYTVLVVHTI